MQPQDLMKKLGRKILLWRERNEHSGCIYNLSKQINENIPIDSVLFILEMNNTKNKIMGIGVIKNRCDPNYHFIYADQMYNRYTYKSNYRIDRSQLTENEKLTIQRIEYFIFKGYKHLKRGQGITLLPSQLCHSKGQVTIIRLNMIKQIIFHFLDHYLKISNYLVLLRFFLCFCFFFVFCLYFL